jgi:hypothetical protein
VVVLVVAVVALAFASGAEARVFVSPCGDALVRPKRIVFTCADAGLRIARIHWRTWGGPVATGDGVLEVNDCNPFCAAGHFHFYPARVQLRHRQRCGRGARYRLATVTGRGLTRRNHTMQGC